jgi:hypothetical protein
MDAAAIITVYRCAHVPRVDALLGLSRRLLGEAGAIA